MGSVPSIPQKIIGASTFGNIMVQAGATPMAMCRIRKPMTRGRKCKPLANKTNLGSEGSMMSIDSAKSPDSCTAALDGANPNKRKRDNEESSKAETTSTPRAQRTRIGCSKPRCKRVAMEHEDGFCKSPVCAPCQKNSYKSAVYPMVCLGCMKPMSLPEVKRTFWGSKPEYESYIQLMNAQPKPKCEICLDDLDDTELPAPVDLKTTHWGHKYPKAACRGCLQQYIREELKSKNLPACPSINCKIVYAHEEILYLTNNDTLNTWKDLKWILDNRGKPNFRECIAQNCSYGQFHVASHPLLKCSRCGMEQCATHKIRWHANMTCAKFDLQQKNTADNKLTKSYLKDNRAKNCPKCRALTIKINGCDHVRCTICRHEYCFVCLADHLVIRNGSNSYHQATCRYWANPGVVAF